jgi:hypothetical protein
VFPRVALQLSRAFAHTPEFTPATAVQHGLKKERIGGADVSRS